MSLSGCLDLSLNKHQHAVHDKTQQSPQVISVDKQHNEYQSSGYGSTCPVNEFIDLTLDNEYLNRSEDGVCGTLTLTLEEVMSDDSDCREAALDLTSGPLDLTTSVRTVENVTPQANDSCSYNSDFLEKFPLVDGPVPDYVNIEQLNHFLGLASGRPSPIPSQAQVEVFRKP